MIAFDGVKRCPQCLQTKPVDEFWRNKNYADGRQQYCKPCLKVRQVISADRKAARQESRP